MELGVSSHSNISNHRKFDRSLQPEESEDWKDWKNTLEKLDRKFSDGATE